MYKITFQIEGATPVIMEANKGDNLLELARRGNVAIDAPCSGNGSCGKCRVKLLSGQVESAPPGTSPRRSTRRAGAWPAAARWLRTPKF